MGETSEQGGRLSYRIIGTFSSKPSQKVTKRCRKTRNSLLSRVPPSHTGPPKSHLFVKTDRNGQKFVRDLSSTNSETGLRAPRGARLLAACF